MKKATSSQDTSVRHPYLTKGFVWPDLSVPRNTKPLMTPAQLRAFFSHRKQAAS